MLARRTARCAPGASKQFGHPHTTYQTSKTMKTKRTKDTTTAPMAESTPSNKPATPQSSTLQPIVSSIGESTKQKPTAPTITRETLTSSTEETAPQTYATPAESEKTSSGTSDLVQFEAVACVFQEGFLIDFPAIHVIPTIPTFRTRRRHKHGKDALTVPITIFFRLKRSDADKVSDTALGRMLRLELARSPLTWKVYNVSREG